MGVQKGLLNKELRLKIFLYGKASCHITDATISCTLTPAASVGSS